MSTIKVDTVRPVTADASLTLQGDNSGTGVSGITIDSSGNATFAQNAKVDTIRPNTTDGSLTLQGDSSGSGVTGITIDSSGNVLVGTTTFTEGTDGYRISSIGRLKESSSDSTASKIHYAFYNPNGQVGNIATNGSATAYNTSSDYRLKTDVQSTVNATERLKALKPVNFAWKVDGSRVDGFLAHEAQEVVPEAVTGTKDAVDDEGNPEYQGIDQSKLVPLLTAALQEAISKIEALTARIEALEIT